jgi:hypothetical protein
MGGGLATENKGVCKCRCPQGDEQFGVVDPYGTPVYPGTSSYITRNQQDGGTGGQFSQPPPYNQQQQMGGMPCDAWCCPEADSGQAVGPLAAPGHAAMHFSVEEKSNLDLVDAKIHNGQGFAGYAQQSYMDEYQQDYHAPPPPPLVNQQSVTGQYGSAGEAHLMQQPQSKVMQQPGVQQQQTTLQQPRTNVMEQPRLRENTDRSQRSMTGSLGSSRSGRTASEWAANQEQFAHLPPLPPGWLRVMSRSTGKLYYCYPETGETTFAEPTGPPPSMTGENDNLPPGWTKMVSNSTGRDYYWHAGMQKSTFEFPTQGDSTVTSERTGSDSQSSLPDGWVQMVSRSSGRIYYFNTVTQESTFAHP